MADAQNFDLVGTLINEKGLTGENLSLKIFSYLDTNEKVKVSMVNKRWFEIAIIDIKALSIKWPGVKKSQSKLYNIFSSLWSQEKIQDFPQNELPYLHSF